ncbi:hypothetical protein HPB47_001666, partial [Ixodes persulcatus]
MLSPDKILEVVQQRRRLKAEASSEYQLFATDGCCGGRQAQALSSGHARQRFLETPTERLGGGIGRCELHAEELGDRRPTQFLRHLQHLLGDKASSLDAAILRELFLQRLPTAVRVGLAAAHRLTLAELAELADRMMEVAGPTINAAQTAPDVTSELAQLRKDLQKLTIEVANLRLVEPSMTTTTIDPTSYVQRLGEAMSSLRPTQTRKPTARQVFIHPALAQSTHVFIRRYSPQKPLKPLYDGPYLVVDRTPKFYTVLLKGRRETVSLDRLKPAFVSPLDTTPTMSQKYAVAHSTPPAQVTQ